MANDAQSQTIPSWVEDDSFEVQTKVTYTINSGHPSPCSATQFKTFWKGLYDNVVVRTGKIQDNTHMDGKYLVDNQRGHNGEENFSANLDITGETNVDGGQMVVYPVQKGATTSDTVTVDWDGVCWVGNSGLDAYSHPFVFKNGSSVVSSTGNFDTVEHITSWKLASDYRKAMCNEVNPDQTSFSIRLDSDSRTDGSETDNESHAGGSGNNVTQDSSKVSPTEQHPFLPTFGRGETYPITIAGANDFVVSGAGMKYKMEFTKGSSNADVVSSEKWLVANGLGRVSKAGVDVTHTPKVTGSMRLFKDCYNFTGSSRVATTLQDINSGVFGLPTGHPNINSNSWKQGEIDYSVELNGYAGSQVVSNSKQLKLQG